ncbi:hypothetical protein SAMN05443665_100470 [Actinomadura meyerae]|uniref:Protein kinase domain-containing protein n=2 Tax=Actinomadura meyerae TaxID=240840 RepID=A0A239EIA1_9ACTN|nr:hypothetical protein SAMN05443665_100470 [Actinomadura meyerae]
MCQRSLVIEATPGGADYHIAEAAHIVAEKPGGPRGAVDRPADIDGIDNLVLLCPSDHRMIDKGDGRRVWSRRKLLQLKRDHESWTAVLASRPSTPAAGRHTRSGPPGPGDVIVVDGEPYRLCAERAVHRDVADHTEGAYETAVHSGGSGTWCQGHVYGEGATEGHAWLRRSDAPPGTDGLRAALADEAALLLELPPHSGLPSLLGLEMTPQTISLVTAMPSPVTLRDRLTRTRPLPSHDELTLLAGALPRLGDALGALHDRGLSHRALSPGTILMPEPGTALLRDLGLAATAPRAGEKDDLHHAPEQAAGATPPGPPADVHRLARILYELITGRPAGRRGRHVAPSVLNPAVPARCDGMFLRALDADPARRPPVRAFVSSLRTAIETPDGRRSSPDRRY